MGEDIEPLDPVDAAAIAEGAIAFEDARPLHDVDELEPEAGLDHERIVLFDDLHDPETSPEADSGHAFDHEDATDPTDQ